MAAAGCREILPWKLALAGRLQISCWAQTKEGSASTGGVVTYNTTGYRSFVDSEGYPAEATPWGTLNAINLNTGEYVWKIPLGEYPALAAQGVPITGSRTLAALS